MVTKAKEIAALGEKHTHGGNHVCVGIYVGELNHSKFSQVVPKVWQVNFVHPQVSLSGSSIFQAHLWI